MSARVVWPLLLGVGVVAEVRSLLAHDQATLSETWRAWARTETTPGRALTYASAAAIALWLPGHLCKAATR